MSVRSRDLDDDESPAIFAKSSLARHQRGAYRVIAAVLLMVTVIGSLLFGGGGVDRWLVLDVLWFGVAASLIGQAICSYVQYVFAWKSWPYFVAVTFSAGMSAAGYDDLVAPTVASWLVSAGVPATNAGYGALLILIIAAAMIDIIPEKILAS